MLLLGNFLGILAHVVDTILYAYVIVVFISVLLSWVSADPYNPIVRFLRGLTDPVFMQARRLMPFLLIGGIDFSPVAVLLGLQLVNTYVVATIGSLGAILGGVPGGIPQ